MTKIYHCTVTADIGRGVGAEADGAGDEADGAVDGKKQTIHSYA